MATLIDVMMLIDLVMVFDLARMTELAMVIDLAVVIWRQLFLARFISSRCLCLTPRPCNDGRQSSCCAEFAIRPPEWRVECAAAPQSAFVERERTDYRHTWMTLGTGTVDRRQATDRHTHRLT